MALNIARFAGFAVGLVFIYVLYLADTERTVVYPLAAVLVVLVLLGGMWGGYVRAKRSRLDAAFDLDTSTVLEKVTGALDTEGLQWEGLSDEERVHFAEGWEILTVRRGDSMAIVGVGVKKGRTWVDISHINKRTWPFIREVSIIVMDALGGEMHRVES
jgi:cation transport ATPase